MCCDGGTMNQHKSFVALWYAALAAGHKLEYHNAQVRNFGACSFPDCPAHDAIVVPAAVKR
jgi:hypothetical protein